MGQVKEKYISNSPRVSSGSCTFLQSSGSFQIDPLEAAVVSRNYYYDRQYSFRPTLCADDEIRVKLEIEDILEQARFSKQPQESRELKPMQLRRLSHLTSLPNPGIILQLSVRIYC